jgi:predicted nucleotidyltransferase
MMQKTETNTIIKKIAQRIKNKLNPDKIILFGSYAYGNPRDTSDIDILIIKDLGENEIRQHRILAKRYLRDIMLENDIDIDVIIDSWERIHERIRIGDLFMKEIIENGQVIYGK